jgi:hypothetical protein
MSSLLVQQDSVVRSPLTKYRQEPMAIAKHRGMIERKLERFFRESEELGWNYDNYVASVLEILTVLHHRNKRRVET